MSYSRYSIEKKQVSTDRGVTWEDVTPTETRQGELVGTATTYLECMDMACDLEKWVVELVDESVPRSFCSERSPRYNTYLPSGIAMSIRFTNGIVCCIDTWTSTSYITRDEYHNSSVTARTATISTGWNPCRKYEEPVLNGREMITGGFCDEITCFYIKEFMPWIDPNGTIKMAYRVHYVREHCSNEWEIDESVQPERITFGERWVKTYEDIYKTTWQHQIAVDIIYEGFGYEDLPYQVVWEDEGEPFDYYYEVTIPEDIQAIDYIRADGVAGSIEGWTKEYQMKIKIDPDNLGNPTGFLAHKKYQYMNSTTDDPNCAWDWWIYNHSGGTKYYVDPSCDHSTQIIPNEWKCVNLGLVGTPCGKQANYATFFCMLYVRNNEAEFHGEFLDNVNVGGLITTFGGDMYFPYKIPSDYGWSDEYLNAAEYGFINREGDKIVLEYVYGKYTNTSGVTQNIIGNAGSTMSVPSDAVDVAFADNITSLPRGIFGGNTALTSVTMNGVTTIGDGAFSGTTNLAISLSFPNSGTTLGRDAFSGSGIVSVDLTNVANSESCCVFRACTSLTSVTIPNTVTSIGQNYFQGCTSLTDVVIPGSLTYVSSVMFAECTSLSSVTLEEGIMYIGAYTFTGDTSLKSIVTPSTVTVIQDRAFSGCSNLEFVTIKGKSDGTRITIYDYAFKNCNIKELTIMDTTPPYINTNTAVWGNAFTFAPQAVILVPAEAVDTFKSNPGNTGWHKVSGMTYPIPSETEWVNIGYVCIGGLRYDYEHKRGRNTAYSNDWFWLPEYRTVGEPYGECSGTEPY